MAEDDKFEALDIAIVGAGIAGLSTAIALRIHAPHPHRVTVFEKYPECTPTFGGPVQLQPNATKILTRYGIADAIQECLTDLHSVHNIHRYSDGELFRSTPAAEVNSAYQSPYGLLFRCAIYSPCFT
jgi:salicylate hydroxylase